MTVTRRYGDFRGVDLRSQETDLGRSPDSVNMWRDYRVGKGIRTRPSMELLATFDDPVDGIFFFGESLLAVAAGDLYVKDTEGWHRLEDGFLANATAFPHGGKLYLLGGGAYWVYDGTTIDSVDGYIPTTSIGRTPQGSGTAHEDVNLLTPWRKNTFRGDESQGEYFLDCRDCDDTMPTVKVDGVELTGDFQWFPQEGKVTFGNPPAPPATDGQDNVEITFCKVHGGEEKIRGCTLAALFDNRVFFSGNPNYPNTVWHSALDDPTYVSDLDYYREGLDQAAVKALVPGNNALWVFREPSQANTNIFYHTPVLDADYGKVYPSIHSSIALGCVGKAVNFNDDIVFLSQRGLEGISGDIGSEQAAAHRSSMVDPALLAEDPEKLALAEWEGYLLLIFGKRIYAADSRAIFAHENHAEYEWFCWEMEKEIRCAAVKDGALYLGCEDGVYTLDGAGDIPSHWTTTKDLFGQSNRLKTSNKRGCVAEAQGDFDAMSKTEYDAGFQLMGQHRGVTDYAVTRMKRKKFKDLQLRYQSSTRFSLEAVTVECYIGGYIKR